MRASAEPAPTTRSATAACSLAKGWKRAACFSSSTEPLIHGSSEQMSWPSLAVQTSTYVVPVASAALRSISVRARFTFSAYA